MSNIQTSLQALRKAYAISKDLEVHAALRHLSTLSTLLGSPGTVKTENKLKFLPENSVLPVFNEHPALAFRTLATFLDGIYHKTATISRSKDRWEGVQQMLISNALDYLENKPSDANRLLAAELFPTIASCYFCQASDSLSGNALLNVVYMFLTDALTSCSANQSTLRRLIGERTLALSISRTSESVTLESLLLLFASLLPPSSDRDRRTQFVKEVFTDDIFPRGKELRARMEDIRSRDWEPTGIALTLILAKCGVQYPQPFTVSNLFVCGRRIDPIGYMFVDGSSLTLTIATGKDGDLDSIKSLFSTVTKAKIVRVSSLSSSVVVELADPPRLGTDTFIHNKASSDVLTWDFELPAEEIKRFVAVLRRRGVTQISATADRKLSTAESTVTLEFSDTQPSTQEKVTEMEKLFSGGLPTSPILEGKKEGFDITLKSEPGQIVNSPSDIVSANPFENTGAFGSNCPSNCGDNLTRPFDNDVVDSNSAMIARTGEKRKLVTSTIQGEDVIEDLPPTKRALRRPSPKTNPRLVHSRKPATAKRYGRRGRASSPSRTSESHVDYDELSVDGETETTLKPMPKLISAMKGRNMKASTAVNHKNALIKNSKKHIRKTRFQEEELSPAVEAIAVRTTRKSAKVARAAIQREAQLETEDDDSLSEVEQRKSATFTNIPRLLTPSPSLSAKQEAALKKPEMKQQPETVELDISDEYLKDMARTTEHPQRDVGSLALEENPLIIALPVRPDQEEYQDREYQRQHKSILQHERSSDQLFPTIENSVTVPESALETQTQSDLFPMVQDRSPLPALLPISESFAPTLAAIEQETQHRHLDATIHLNNETINASPIDIASYTTRTASIPPQAKTPHTPARDSAPTSPSLSALSNPEYRQTSHDAGLQQVFSPDKQNHPYNLLHLHSHQRPPQRQECTTFGHHGQGPEQFLLEINANFERSSHHERDAPPAARPDATKSTTLIYQTAMDDILDTLDKLHQVLRQQVRRRFETVRQDVRQGRNIVLSDAAQRLSELSSEASVHYQKMVELQGRYSEGSRQVIGKMDESIRADFEVGRRVKKVVQQHDRHSLSKEMPKSLFSTPMPLCIVQIAL